MAILNIGDIVDRRYRILHVVGSGDFGTVYKAEHNTYEGEIYALKELHEALSLDTAEAQVKTEMKALRKLDHPNIAKVHDCFEFRGSTFIAYEFVNGKTLEEMLKFAKDRDSMLSSDDFFILSTQLLSAIVYAHANGVVHRDLKLSNIMTTPERIIKVIDFGLAVLIPEPVFQSYSSFSGRRHLSENTKSPKYDIFCAGDVVSCILSTTNIDAQKKELLEQMLDTACERRPEKRFTAQKMLEQFEKIFTQAVSMPVPQQSIVKYGSDETASVLKPAQAKHGLLAGKQQKPVVSKVDLIIELKNELSRTNGPVSYVNAALNSILDKISKSKYTLEDAIILTREYLRFNPVVSYLGAAITFTLQTMSALQVYNTEEVALIISAFPRDGVISYVSASVNNILLSDPYNKLGAKGKASLIKKYMKFGSPVSYTGAAAVETIKALLDSSVTIDDAIRIIDNYNSGETVSYVSPGVVSIIRARV